MRRKTVALASDADRADRRFLSRTTHPQICRRELAPIYSNRSASFLKLSKVSQALSDAERCIELRPDWDKAYFRKATALEAQDDDDAALVQFEVRKGFFFRPPDFVRGPAVAIASLFLSFFHRPTLTERPNARTPSYRGRDRNDKKQEALRVATEDQTGMLEQKIRLCKQRVARAKRAEHHQPKKAHGEKEVAGKVRDKGSGFKFAGAAVQAQNKMKALVKNAAGAAPEEKQEPKAPAPAAGEGTDENAEAEAQKKKAAEEKAAAAAKAAAEKKAAEEKAAEEKAAAAAKAAAAKKAAEEKAAAAAAAAAEKAKVEQAAAEQAAAAADKAATDEAAAKKAALANRRAKAAAAKKAEEDAAAAAAAATAAKPAPKKSPRPEAKKSPRPSKRSEPMPVWLPVAVLGGVGALMFAVIAIGGARSRNRV